MPRVGTVINGRRQAAPGVYAITNDDGFAVPTPDPIKRGLIIGQAFGGAPRKFTKLDPTNYARILRGGAIMRALDAAIDPSDDVPGLGEFEFYRINAAVAGTRDLGDLIVTARPHLAGLLSLNISIERTPMNGGVIIDVVDTSSRLTETSPVLGPSLLITYLGSAASPTATIANTGGNKTLQLVGDSPSEAVTVLLGAGGAGTIQALADIINSSVGWTAQVLNESHLFDPALMAAGALIFDDDDVTLDLGAAAQVAWLEGSELIEAELGDDPATGLGTGPIFLQGGAEGAAPTTQDYLDALEAAQTRDVQAVWVQSDDPGVQAALAAHCTVMSHEVERRERRAFIGAPLVSGKAPQMTAAIALAKEMASRRVTAGGLPILKRNPRSGKVETYSPNEYALIIMGMACGVRPEVDLTFKTLKISGLVHDLSNADVNELIEAGVHFAWFDYEDEIYRVKDDVTTYQTDANLYRRLRFGQDIQDYLKRKIRSRSKKHVGRVGSLTDVVAVKASVLKALTEEVRNEESNQGFLQRINSVQVYYDGLELVTVKCDVVGVGRIGQIVVDTTLRAGEITV